MTKQSPHKRWKGHDMLCSPHKLKGAGRAAKTPWRELRKIGKKRRLSRNETGE
jgi:hypothetical protein